MEGSLVDGASPGKLADNIEKGLSIMETMDQDSRKEQAIFWRKEERLEKNFPGNVG